MMNNRIVATGTFGPVYARKIDVYYKNELTGGIFRYAYSTNAYPTCKAARNAAIASFPNSHVMVFSGFPWHAAALRPCLAPVA